MLVRILTVQRRRGFIPWREIVTCDVDDFDLGMVALFRDAINPPGNSFIITARPRTSGYDCDLKHSISPSHLAVRHTGWIMFVITMTKHITRM
jgi:hypothetical protein